LIENKELVDNNNENYSIGSQVIVNTDHIFEKRGTIQFIGKICIKRGIWYGIELKEAVGK
jgi:dynactin complex subunit